MTDVRTYLCIYFLGLHNMSTLKVWQVLPWKMYPAIIPYILSLRWLYFSANSPNSEKPLLDSSGSSVLPSVCMVSVRPDWTDFYEIFYLSPFRKCVEKIQVSLPPDTNNGYFRWRPMRIDDHTSLIFLSMRNVSDKFVQENQNIIFSITVFFPKTVQFMR